jgi:hypothetical protein
VDLANIGPIFFLEGTNNRRLYHHLYSHIIRIFSIPQLRRFAALSSDFPEWNKPAIFPNLAYTNEPDVIPGIISAPVTMSASPQPESAIHESSDGSEIAVSFLAANIYGTLLGTLPALLLLILFGAVWSGRRLAPLANGISLALIVILLLVGIVVHEVLHAVGWHLFGQVPRHAIKFGFKWKVLTPYAHSRAPMPVNGYRWGTILPGLLLGILPSLLATAVGNGFLLAFGLFFTFAAGGDFLILWLLRGVPGEAQVADHPSKVGCVVYV